MEGGPTTSTFSGAKGFHEEPRLNMQSARLEDYGDDIPVEELAESLECSFPSMTIFRNPAGLAATFLSGLGFYSALAYGVWRVFHG